MYEEIVSSGDVYLPDEPVFERKNCSKFGKGAELYIIFQKFMDIIGMFQVDPIGVLRIVMTIFWI